MTQSGSEEQKRKFREALDKKKSTPVVNDGAKGGSKVNTTHGPATKGSMFRRKSV